MPLTEYGIVILRLLLATILGGIVGFERESAHRPAGLRTHVLVCVGSALIMMVSTHMYEAYRGLTNVDPGRIAAQVVSGIGFLGAGTIMREGATIRGLTTAASLWVVAGIGLAVGAGYYLGAVTAAGIVLGALVFLSRFEQLFITKAYNHVLKIKVKDQPGQLGRIGTVLGKYAISIKNVQMRHSEGADHLLEIELHVLMPTAVDLNKLNEDLLVVDGIVALQHDE